MLIIPFLLVVYFVTDANWGENNINLVVAEDGLSNRSNIKICLWNCTLFTPHLIMMNFHYIDENKIIFLILLILLKAIDIVSLVYSLHPDFSRPSCRANLFWGPHHDLLIARPDQLRYSLGLSVLLPVPPVLLSVKAVFPFRLTLSRWFLAPLIFWGRI